MNKIQPNRELCAYCQSPKTTDDHIPPRNIFSGDRTNLITVPSCDEHNAKRSHLDERFRNYVAMRVGGNTPTTKTLWGKMVRGIQKNKKFQEKFRRNSLWRPELNAFEVEIESDAFKPMIEWITRGLYWHVYQGESLPLNIDMEISEMRIGEWMRKFTSDMARAAIGGDQFYYACKRMDEHPTVSIWLYAFHRRLITIAMTDTVLSDKIVAEYNTQNSH
jgi:hypothetical protein